MSVFEPKTLSRTNNPSISFFVWVISHRDDEWTSRAFARFSLSLFQRPNSSPSLSFTRYAYEMYTSQRDKETEERERKQKNVFPNTTKGGKPKRKFTQNRDWWENECVRTYHSCELAYFNPSMTVLYICTPLARLNKGANAVVLEVNCFKVCLSAMMKSCVVRVQCDAQRSASLALPRSRSRPRDCFFGRFFARWRENTSLSCVFDLFFLDFFETKI